MRYCHTEITFGENLHSRSAELSGHCNDYTTFSEQNGGETAYHWLPVVPERKTSKCERL